MVVQRRALYDNLLRLWRTSNPSIKSFPRRALAALNGTEHEFQWEDGRISDLRMKEEAFVSK